MHIKTPAQADQKSKIKKFQKPTLLSGRGLLGIPVTLRKRLIFRWLQKSDGRFLLETQ